MRSIRVAFAAFAVCIGTSAVVDAQGTAPGALGISMSDHSAGVLVTGVRQGSPAAQIGLRSGDRILAINGQTVRNNQDVTRLIGNLPVNERINLRVARGAWTTEMTATLGDARQVLAAPLNRAPAAAPLGIPAVRPVYVAPAARNPFYNLTPADLDDQHGYGS